MTNEVATEPSSTLDASQSSVAAIDSTAPPPPVDQAQPSNTTSDVQVTAAVEPVPETPVRRGPGRPRGSGKKRRLDADQDNQSITKVKRPVGRPRKDGLPAGSLAPGKGRRPVGRPRKSAPGELGGNSRSETSQFRQQALSGNVIPYSGASMQSYFPLYTSSRQQQWQSTFPVNTASKLNHSAHPMGSLPSDVLPPIDPELEKEDWATLARTKPNEFLRILITSLPDAASVDPNIEDAFRAHLTSLTPADGGGKEHAEIPSLYSTTKTFWLPSSPTYFALTASASAARTPSAHRFLYWDPQPLLFNGISCPACTAPLINKGRIRSGPIKVYDLGAPFFIVGCEYHCRSATCTQIGTGEGRRFASTDAGILHSLPPPLRKEIPVHLLLGSPENGGDLGPGANVWNGQALGVSDALYQMVRGCLRAGLARDAILGVIHGIQIGGLENQWMPQPDEEEEEEDAEHEEEAREEEVPQRKATDGTTTAHDNGPFFSAWKANVTVPAEPHHPSANGQVSHMDFSGVPAPPTPVSATTAAPQMQVYPYTPSGQFTTYPYTYGPWYQHNPQPVAQNGDAADPAGALKRSFEGSPIAGGSGEQHPLKRIRHCCKCGSQDCKGKGGRAFCMNPCQDCGKLECQGRNSKRPDKTCHDAWP